MLRDFFVQNCMPAWERIRFRPMRADYYGYLASLLHGTQGSRTLRDVFLQDAQRYAQRTLRGRLSQRWLHAYQRSGGDLYATWSLHFPHGELAMIRAAQSLGNEAVVQVLGEISRVLQTLHQARRIVDGTLWPAAVGVVLAVLVSLAVPWFTVPHLLQAFSAVPVDYYGSLTRRLISFAGLAERQYAAAMVGTLAALWFVVWSLPNLKGSLRARLDHHLWWRLWRCVAALQFLSFLGVSLGGEQQSATRLRSALLLQRAGASPWLAAHIDVMVGRLDRGIAGSATFDTGLLDREQFWFLSDMVAARGLRHGLTLTCDRLHSQILGSIARQATVMRWTILLLCVGFVLGLALWHYAVIDELRRSLTFYLSAQ